MKGTADNVTVTDAAPNSIKVEGMWHFGGSLSANSTPPRSTSGHHLRIIGQGAAAVDDISAVLTGSPFGDMWIDIGTCVPLG